MRNLLLLLIFISSLGIAQDKPFINNNIEGVTCELPIPDNMFVTGASGTVANMVCVTIVGPGGIVSNMSVEISLDHTWVGDITAIVVAPDTTTMVTILDRPSRTDNAGAGDSSNFIETAPITFADSSANDSDDMGNTIAGAEFVCQDDGVCDYFHIQDETINGNNLADFNGMNATGNWQICVGDSAAGDQGGVCAAGTSITFINIGAVAVPTPGNGMIIDFMMNLGFNLPILNDLGAGADDDLDNIQCGFSGGDAGQFSVTSGQPAGPIAPGNSANIALAVNVVPLNTVYTSTLNCTFDNDLDDSSFSWPVSA
ncbi:MAG: hypothetical protein L3J52_03765, partial [Proteobacteria bacterium]|nr:hypothetical protein [Pseudomonadota bacterium]